MEFLRRRDERWQSWFKEAVERYGTTPTERLLAVFDVLKEWFDGPDFRGCAFVNATVELANPEHPAHQVVLDHKQAIYQYILKMAQDAGVHQPESLSRQFMLLAEGAIAVALIERNSASAQQARAAASALLAATLM